MNTTDPIADMLTRIRNANSAKKQVVDIPASNMKKAIAEILVEQGYIKSFEEIKDEKQGVIRVTLKYDEKSKPVISNLKRVSRPGLRNYCKAKDIPQVLGGMGIAIISTSKGLLTDRKARKENVGGEILCYVW